MAWAGIAREHPQMSGQGSRVGKSPSRLVRYSLGIAIPTLSGVLYLIVLNIVAAYKFFEPTPGTIWESGLETLRRHGFHPAEDAFAALDIVLSLAICFAIIITVGLLWKLRRLTGIVIGGAPEAIGRFSLEIGATIGKLVAFVKGVLWCGLGSALIYASWPP